MTAEVLEVVLLKRPARQKKWRRYCTDYSYSGDYSFVSSSSSSSV